SRIEIGDSTLRTKVSRRQKDSAEEAHQECTIQRDPCHIFVLSPQGVVGCGANRPAAFSLKNPIFRLLTPTLMVPTTRMWPSGSSATAPARSSFRSPAPNEDDQYTVSPEMLTLQSHMLRVPTSPSVPRIRYPCRPRIALHTDTGLISRLTPSEGN